MTGLSVRARGATFVLGHEDIESTEESVEARCRSFEGDKSVGHRLGGRAQPLDRRSAEGKTTRSARPHENSGKIEEPGIGSNDFGRFPPCAVGDDETDRTLIGQGLDLDRSGSRHQEIGRRFNSNEPSVEHFVVFERFSDSKDRIGQNEMSEATGCDSPSKFSRVLKEAYGGSGRDRLEVFAEARLFRPAATKTPWTDFFGCHGSFNFGEHDRFA